jgi:hypothetical protein
MLTPFVLMAQENDRSVVRRQHRASGYVRSDSFMQWDRSIFFRFTTLTDSKFFLKFDHDQ